jgi:hypothetical protein
VAAGFSLIVPTGSEGNFQGLGQTRVVPSIVGSWVYERFDFHGTLGVEFSGAGIDQTRGRYGVGASWGALRWLTLLVDVIGNSAFADTETLIGQVATPSAAEEVQTVQGVTVSGNDVFVVVGRQDIVDLSVGLKVNPFGNFVAFASAIVPLTSDGIRANVIPAVGLSYAF